MLSNCLKRSYHYHHNATNNPLFQTCKSVFLFDWGKWMNIFILLISLPLLSTSNVTIWQERRIVKVNLLPRTRLHASKLWCAEYLLCQKFLWKCRFARLFHVYVRNAHLHIRFLSKRSSRPGLCSALLCSCLAQGWREGGNERWAISISWKTVLHLVVFVIFKWGLVYLSEVVLWFSSVLFSHFLHLYLSFLFTFSFPWFHVVLDIICYLWVCVCACSAWVCVLMFAYGCVLGSICVFPCILLLYTSFPAAPCASIVQLLRQARESGAEAHRKTLSL